MFLCARCFYGDKIQRWNFCEILGNTLLSVCHIRVYIQYIHIVFFRAIGYNNWVAGVPVFTCKTGKTSLHSITTHCKAINQQVFSSYLRQFNVPLPHNLYTYTCIYVVTQKVRRLLLESMLYRRAGKPSNSAALW